MPANNIDTQPRRVQAQLTPRLWKSGIATSGSEALTASRAKLSDFTSNGYTIPYASKDRMNVLEATAEAETFV